jgi:hypothetical protein
MTRFDGRWCSDEDERKILIKNGDEVRREALKVTTRL